MKSLLRWTIGICSLVIMIDTASASVCGTNLVLAQDKSPVNQWCLECPGIPFQCIPIRDTMQLSVTNSNVVATNISEESVILTANVGSFDRLSEKSPPYVKNL